MERLRGKVGKDAWDAGGEMRLRGEMESVREFAREWEMGGETGLEREREMGRRWEFVRE